MQLPDFNQQLASDRQSRYRADAARSRLTRPDRSVDGRASSAASVRGPTDTINESNSVLDKAARTPTFVAVGHAGQSRPAMLAGIDITLPMAQIAPNERVERSVGSNACS